MTLPERRETDGSGQSSDHSEFEKRREEAASKRQRFVRERDKRQAAREKVATTHRNF